MKKLLIIVTLMLSVIPAGAEDTNKTYQLDLQTAIKTALDNNPSLQPVKENEAMARARLEQAKASGNVKLNLNSSYNWVSDPTLFGGMEVVEKNTNVNTISASKPLYTGGAIEAAKNQAKSGIDAALEQNTTAQESMVVAVTATYIRALQAKEWVRVADESVAFHQSNLDAANKLRQAGVVAKADVYRAETELASAKEKQIQAVNNYQNSLAVLKSMLNMNQSGEIVLSDTVSINETAKSDWNVNDRAEIRALQNVLKAAEYAVKQADAGRKPKIEASVDFLNIGAGAEFPRTDNTLGVGVRFTMPLSDGGSTKANVDEAKSAVRKAQKDIEAETRQVELEEQQAELALTSADARIQSSDAQLKSAAESLRAIRVSYSEGIAPITDVLAAHTAFLDAEYARLSSLYDKQIAQVNLMKAQGKVLSLMSGDGK